MMLNRYGVGERVGGGGGGGHLEQKKERYIIV